MNVQIKKPRNRRYGVKQKQHDLTACISSNTPFCCFTAAKKDLIPEQTLFFSGNVQVTMQGCYPFFIFSAALLLPLQYESKADPILHQ